MNGHKLLDNFLIPIIYILCSDNFLVIKSKFIIIGTEMKIGKEQNGIKQNESIN